MSRSYQGIGSSSVVMRGRDALFRQIVGSLTKTTPANLSLVGPKYIGKTVVLRHLARHFGIPAGRYDVVAHWDLRSMLPADNEAFLQGLCKTLRDALAGSSSGEDLAEYLSENDLEPEERIDLVVGSAGRQFLILIDHFDRITYSSRITKNLWDYLASLARRDNLRFVIASQNRLYDLVADRDSKTSYFWELFETIPVKPFAVDDIDGLIEPLKTNGIDFEKGYAKQLVRVSGGHPAIIAGLLDALEDSGSRQISVNAISAAGRELREPLQDCLHALWDECPANTQGDVIDMAVGAQSPVSLTRARQDLLVSRGFALVEGTRVVPQCDVMLDFAREQRGGAFDLRNLLVSPEVEARSLRKLLEMKLEAVSGGNDHMRAIVLHAIRGLDAGLTPTFGLVRDIAKEGIHLAWKAEFPDDKVPTRLHALLTKRRGDGGYELDHNLFERQQQVTARLRILRAMSGAGGSPRLTRRASRPLMTMLDHLYTVGNFGEHIADSERGAGGMQGVDLNFCASVCWTAVTLFGRLSEECA